MSYNSVANDKKLLRATLAQQRKALATDPMVRAGLMGVLTSLIEDTGAKTVAAYLPYGTEPDIGAFVDGAAANGVRLIMPVSQQDGTLRWVEYTGASAPGIFGFDEPTGPDASLAEADLILIPASAADSNGNRLGKGKGYYDVALAEPELAAKVAAVVYEAEVLDSVPVEPHDQPVDFVVTPVGLIRVAH